jgi:hypothetical protein
LKQDNQDEEERDDADQDDEERKHDCRPAAFEYPSVEQPRS